MTFLRALLLVPLALGGCAQDRISDKALAAEIEAQVRSRHPDVRLEQYARFYARAPDGMVEAIFVYAYEGFPLGRAGQSVWVRPGALPKVNDGGCSVINIRYSIAAHALRSIACNGSIG